jgi:hypothetical protein
MQVFTHHVGKNLHLAQIATFVFLHLGIDLSGAEYFCCFWRYIAKKHLLNKWREVVFFCPAKAGQK